MQHECGKDFPSKMRKTHKPYREKWGGTLSCMKMNIFYMTNGTINTGKRQAVAWEEISAMYTLNKRFRFRILKFPTNWQENSKQPSRKMEE